MKLTLFTELFGTAVELLTGVWEILLKKETTQLDSQIPQQKLQGANGNLH
jgi:hypothetical protein